jgi:exopolyphosphatase/guanosine-5'-triphosphate,3'-diphosphate pyrophosphatase
MRRDVDKASSVGLIDLGSNSIRLLVFRINPNKSYTVLTRHKQMIRLGEGAFSSNRLSGEAMKRAMDAIRNMADLCRGYDVSDVEAYATAAVRDAKNGADFVEQAANETGIKFSMISGLEEARLIHLGVATGLTASYERGLFIDIGGGSTEMIVGNQALECLYLDSLKLGSVRVANIFAESSGAGPISPNLYEKLKSHVRNSSLHSIFRIRDMAPDILVGSSGTIQNLAEMASRAAKSASPREAQDAPDALSLDALAEVAKKLCSISVAERGKIPGINPQRADIIVAGAAILQTLMEELDMREIQLSSRGLLDGMLQDYLERGRLGYLDRTMSTRDWSVLQLARSCDFDESHSMWVTRLALTLFDSARAIGLHSYGEDERELLSYAAILHDIGLFLSFDDHHAHSRYMIKNSEPLGFNRREVDVMANAVYFHRKWSDKRNRRDADYNMMSKDDRKISRTLGVFLRMAEGLDRSQRQTVRSARFESSKRVITLILELASPSPMEIYSTERAIGQFKKIFGREYVIKPVNLPDNSDDI